MDIKIVFVPPDAGQPGIVTNVELHFPESSALAGLKLVGFAVRAYPDDGRLFVTLPARGFGSGQEKRYFDYVRSVSGDHRETNALRRHILDAWRTHVQTSTAAANAMHAVMNKKG